MNFTVTSKGRQFDRLGIMYLGDVEVFRTSTAEPTSNGILWTYVKQMDQYYTLWKENQKVIFDLGNIVDNTYTGPYFTTLTATFFTVPDPIITADSIFPISAKQSEDNAASAFSLPDQTAKVSYVFPKNVERAAVSLSGCGQLAEEFWYTNVFSSDVDTFEETTGTLGGYGPFREVQLLIDGQLAGVSWPFPIIFTGGIAPGFWRPIVGIDAFDLRQHEIDVTPWLGLLCDGASHSFEIRVGGLNDDGNGHATLSDMVGSYWVVTGTIFLFLGEAESITTGTGPNVDAGALEILITSQTDTNDAGANQSLTYSTEVRRRISVSSTITSSRGSRSAGWTQSLSYTNLNDLTDQGLVQYTKQDTSGTDDSQNGYSNTYDYPLTVTSSFSVDDAGQVGINASLSRGLSYNVYGPSVFPSGIQEFDASFTGGLLSTTQTGIAEYFSGVNTSYSFGTTEQNFNFSGAPSQSPDAVVELYSRHVVAVNSTVMEDEQTGGQQASRLPAADIFEEADLILNEGAFSVRALLGRGPGQPKPGIENL